MRKQRPRPTTINEKVPENESVEVTTSTEKPPELTDADETYAQMCGLYDDSKTNSIGRPALIKNITDLIDTAFYDRVISNIKNIEDNRNFTFCIEKDIITQEIDIKSFLKFIKDKLNKEVNFLYDRNIFINLDSNTLLKLFLNCLPGYKIVSVLVTLMSTDVNEGLKAFNKVLDVFKNLSVSKERYINLSWYYNTPSGYYHTTIQDPLTDSFHQEAYPYLDIKELAKEYAESEEPVLILLGQPGTGKTRLIRYILNEICEIKDRNINVTLTSDQVIIENGDLFIRFIGNEDDFLILEDIDYHLESRREGNTAMYNFLSISNGLAVGHQKRKKVILSTNLPNVSNMDAALLRPGRCFGIIETRPLYYNESLTFIKKIGIEKDLEPQKSYTLAELYNFGRNKSYLTDADKYQSKDKLIGF